MSTKYAVKFAPTAEDVPVDVPTFEEVLEQLDGRYRIDVVNTALYFKDMYCRLTGVLEDTEGVVERSSKDRDSEKSDGLGSTVPTQE